MFCKKCGKELKNEEKFCSTCGTVAGEDEAEEKIRDKAKKLNAKSVKAILGILAVAAVIVSALAVFGNRTNRSPETVAKTFIESYYEADGEKMLGCLPKGMVNVMKMQCGGSKKALIKYIETNMSSSDKVSCKIISAEIYTDSDELEDYIEDDEFSVFLADASDYRLVEVGALIDGDIETNIVFCAKIGGKWYVANMD